MTILQVTREEMTETVTFEDAAHVLFVMNGNGYEPGSFTKSLIQTMALADHSNMMKLAKAFPSLAVAVYAYQNLDFGLEVLLEIMQKGTRR